MNESGLVVDLIDGNGILLARHPHDATLVGRPGSDDPVVNKALRDPSGTAELPNLKGEVRLFAFQKVRSVDWVVAVGITHAAVVGPIDSALQKRLGLIAVIVLSSCVIGLVGGETFVFWPLRALAQTAQALERGDLAARPRLSGVGEVGDLERSLNRMAAAIQHRETDLKNSQAALEKAVRAASQANEAKSQFLASMSHEIRTPLSSIVGYNDLLLAQPLEPEQRRYAERIGSAAAAVIAVIDGILDISRIEAREVEIEQRPFGLHSLVDDVVSMVRGNAAPKGLGLKVELGPDLPAAVQGDEMRVRQVLLNLLANAIKFTASGTVTLRVQQARREGRIRFTVVDTGIGIAKAQHHRLFKRFSQVHDKSGRDYGGTGLGLAISKELSEMMGGELGFSSKPAQGSTFWMELALPKVDEAEIARQTPSVQPARAGLILVADDQEMSREITSAMLTMAGHEVDVVADGAEAVEAVQRKAYDLVLMDIQMSGMDGVAAMNRIRLLDGPASKVPVIAMTANVMPQQVRDFTRAGMDDHLGKPFTRDQLISKVEAFLTPARAASGAVGDPADHPAIFQQHALDEMKRLLGEERTAAWVNMLRTQLETIVTTRISATPREKLAKTAHALVSQAGSLGFTRLSRLSSELEEACLQRSDYHATLSRVQKACREALRRIDRMQNRKSDHLVGTNQT
jgi:signal transduction histidine kinase/DNA-binding response OmpR family regulator